MIPPSKLAATTAVSLALWAAIILAVRAVL